MNRLSLKMEDFSFFGKDKEQMIIDIHALIEAGHFLTLRMTQSTSLSHDLCILNHHIASKPGVEMEYIYRLEFKGSLDSSRVSVVLFKEESE